MLFTICLAFLLTHELDAMTAREWRIFPGLSRLSDEMGRFWFVVLHVPLFGIILAGLLGPNVDGYRLGLTVFALCHFAAHILLHRHQENGFRRPLSWVLIGGAAVFAVADLLVNHDA